MAESDLHTEDFPHSSQNRYGDQFGDYTSRARLRRANRIGNSLFCLVGGGGFEPPTNGLKGASLADAYLLIKYLRRLPCSSRSLHEPRQAEVCSALVQKRLQRRSRDGAGWRNQGAPLPQIQRTVSRTPLGWPPCFQHVPRVPAEPVPLPAQKKTRCVDSFKRGCISRTTLGKHRQIGERNHSPAAP